MARKPAKDMTLEEVTSWLGNAEPGSPTHAEMLGELHRRQTLVQIQAAEAQERAASAAERYTAYTFWIMVTASVAAIASALGIVFQVVARFSSPN
jgi:hypothetical protein